MRQLLNFSIEILRSNESADMDSIAKLNKDGFDNENRMAQEDTISFLLQPNTHLIVARNEQGEIIGKATLFIFMLDHGKKFGLVHNVAVLKEWRSRGVAKEMEKMWCEIAKTKGCAHVDLTSNKPEAIALYLKTRYMERETTVFRKML